MIQKTSIFFLCKYILQITNICCTLNLCCLKIKFDYTHYSYNLFIFLCYVSYLGTYLSILDMHTISLYNLHLLPLQYFSGTYIDGSFWFFVYNLRPKRDPPKLNPFFQKLKSNVNHNKNENTTFLFTKNLNTTNR